MSFDYLPLTIKSGVLANKAYTLKPENCSIKLNQNESPYDLPGFIKEQVINRMKESNWNIYPEFIPEEVYRKVAKHLNTEFDQILIGNGSNEMINTILTSSVESGKKVIIPVPTFTVYGLISSNLNGNIVNVPLNDDMTFDVAQILQESKTIGSVTVICSPNNPTGSYMKIDDIENIVKNSGGIVIIDEAYIHFGGQTAFDLLKKYDNLVILRTFSKAYGLAGLRIGVMISNTTLIKEFSKVKLPYNLNIFTINTLSVILDNPEFIKTNIHKIMSEKTTMFNKLSKYNSISVYPSEANFFLIKTADSSKLFNYLKNNGVLIRDVSSYQKLKNHLRISVGSPDENTKLYSLLDKY